MWERKDGRRRGRRGWRDDGVEEEDRRGERCERGRTGVERRRGGREERSVGEE